MVIRPIMRPWVLHIHM